MKVHETNSKQFKPIHLILENQEEVDAICTIVNSVQIVRVFPVLDGWLIELANYGNTEKNINKLIKVLRK